MSCTGARGVGASLVICDGQAADGARGVEAREALRPRHARSLLACAALRGHSARGCAHCLRTANDTAALRPLWLAGRGTEHPSTLRGRRGAGTRNLWSAEMRSVEMRQTSLVMQGADRPAPAAEAAENPLVQSALDPQSCTSPSRVAPGLWLVEISLRVCVWLAGVFFVIAPYFDLPFPSLSLLHVLPREGGGQLRPP